MEVGERRRVAATELGHDGALGQAGGLGRVVEVRRDGIATTDSSWATAPLLTIEEFQRGGGVRLSNGRLDVSVVAHGASVAAGQLAAACVLSGVDGGGELGDLVERLLADGVIDPASLAPVGDQAGLLEGLEVKRESRLCRADDLRELTDTTVAV